MSGEYAPQPTRSAAGPDRNLGTRTPPSGGGGPGGSDLPVDVLKEAVDVLKEPSERNVPGVPGVPDVPGVRLMAPGDGDGREMWRIARDTDVLDVNSPYSYLLWCRDFADSSVVARATAGGGGVCGFITGYIRPASPDTLFVWQVAVDQAHRGNGLAKRMLDYLGDRVPVAAGSRYLEATVTPDNDPSSRLFAAFARDRGCAIERRTLFTREQFPRGHQPEVLFRIGPF